MESMAFPYRPQGAVVDVGANVGWYSFLFAHAGYVVHSFEALPSNVQLLNASMCANPKLAENVKVHTTALSAAPVGNCKVYSSKRNIGNGTLCCPGERCPYEGHPMYDMRQEVSTSTLDDALSKIEQRIGFIKIDVEGYECRVLQGGAKTFARTPPRFLMSEIWSDEVGCSAADYLSLLRKLGYAVGLNKTISSGFLASESDTASAKDFDHIADVFAVYQR